MTIDTDVLYFCIDDIKIKTISTQMDSSRKLSIEVNEITVKVRFGVNFIKYVFDNEAILATMVLAEPLIPGKILEHLMPRVTLEYLLLVNQVLNQNSESSKASMWNSRSMWAR